MPTIIWKRSTTSGEVPISDQLQVGEAAVNTADAHFYTKHTDGSVKRVGTTADSVKVVGSGIIPEGNLQTALEALADSFLPGGGSSPTFNGPATFNSDIVLGDSGTDSVNLISQLVTDSTPGSVGQALVSRGPNISPKWGSQITGLRETGVALTGSVIDLNLGNLFYKTVDAAVTLSATNVAASGVVNTFILELINGGSHTVTWPINVRWTNGAAPTLTASGRDVLGLITRDGGVSWLGFVLGKDVR